MSINAFPLSPQAGDNLATRIFKSYILFRQRCVSAILLSIQLLSSHSNRPITMILPTTLSKLQHI